MFHKKLSFLPTQATQELKHKYTLPKLGVWGPASAEEGN